MYRWRSGTRWWWACLAMAASLATVTTCPGWGEDPEPAKFPAAYPGARDRLRAQEASLQAMEQMANGQWAEAGASLAEAVEASPTIASPRALLGAVLEQSGNREGAVRAYRDALAWDPDNEAALAALDRLGEAPNETELEEYEALLRDLINAEREQRGLPVLEPHPVLAEVARRHSQDMRDQGFFAHESPLPGKRTAADRFLLLFDGPPAILAENVARRSHTTEYSLSAANIRATHEGLMQSEGHRANILLLTTVYLGVGLTTNENGDYWLTEMFMRPARPPLGS